MADRGYLLIADITGYTRFLTGSELDHAQGVLADLFGVILDRLQSPLALSNIQGDAFFAYANDDDILSTGQILDAIEALYFGFRERLTSIVDNTTCQCRACANVGKLDLKFVVHHGDYVSQEVAGRTELSGPDVILLHRLLKNDVPDQTGIASYALFTAAAVEKLDLAELREDTAPYATTLDEFGAVDGAVLDLGERWKRHYAESEIVVGDDELWMAPVTRVLPFDLDVVWEAYWNPEIQSRWNTTTNGISRVTGDPKRIRAGAVDHCAHGKQTLVFRYVDVRPLKHVTVDCAIPMNGIARWTVALWPEQGRTHMAVTIARPTSTNALMTFVLRVMSDLLEKKWIRQNFVTELALLDDYLADQERRGASATRGSPSYSDGEIAEAAKNIVAR